MGARMSRMPENRAPIVTATKPPTSLPDAYNIPASRWSSRNRRECRPPAAAAAAPACATFAPDNCRPSNTNITAAKTTAAAAAPARPSSADGGAVVKAAGKKEVIAFHSTAKWREYFEASKQSDKLVVIYFTAKWCGPCRNMEPTIKDLAAKNTMVDLVKIDVDELFNVSREYGIQAMPTFLFTKKGKEIDKVVGARKEDLERKIEKHRV